MSSPAISIHVVSHANASLLDSVDDDVFDHAVQPELLRAFLANPANLLVVAVAEGQVVGMATGISYVHPNKPLVYEATGGVPDDEHAVVYVYPLKEESGQQRGAA